MIPVSAHRLIEQALQNALLIQGAMQSGSPEKMDARLAEDDQFLDEMLANPGVLELLRDLLENEEDAATPLANGGGYERMLRKRLQREIRVLADETNGVAVEKNPAAR